MRKKIFLILTILLLCFLVGWRYFYHLPKIQGKSGYGKIDYAVFYAAGASITKVIPDSLAPAQIYNHTLFSRMIKKVRNEKGGTRFFYLPSAILFFTPLNLFRINVSWKIWSIISVLALCLGFYFGLKIFDKKPKNIFYIILLAAGMMAVPFCRVMQTGQINSLILLLLMLSIFYLKKNKELLAGLFLAISAAIKIFPVFFIIIFIIYKKWKALASFIISITIFFLISLPFCGFDSYQSFYKIMPTLQKGDIVKDEANYSLNTLFEQTNITTEPLKYIGAFVLLISLLIIYKSLREKKDYFLDFNILLVFFLIFTSGTHYQYNIFLLPLLAYFLFLFQNKKNKCFCFLALIIFSFTFLSTQIYRVFPSFMMIPKLYHPMTLWLPVLLAILLYLRYTVKITAE